jgi:predicted nucleic acid-binding Zn ribbon protein
MTCEHCGTKVEKPVSGRFCSEACEKDHEEENKRVRFIQKSNAPRDK